MLGSASGGVAIFYQGNCRVLTSVCDFHYVLVVLDVQSVGKCIVGGVYIPPAQSRFV